ncbi:MAG TPA: MFS transporter [Nocardioidaceae bacterium]|nr:MFS transporter [Nocardioidaceae bacterium]
MGTLSVNESRGRWVLAATILGSGMAILDSTIVNIALPAIDDDLDAGTAGLTWTVNAYTLTLASLILLGGSLGDRLGRRRIFVIGVVWFTAASLACGLAPNVELLVVARALQGIGGALLTPGSLAILQASFRPEDRSRAIGVWSGVTGLAAVAGPLLGGMLLELGSWRWIFLVNLPLAAVVLALSRHVPETKGENATTRADLPGVVLAVAGLGLLTFGLSERSLAYAVAGLLGLVGFVVNERRSRQPMLPLAVFRSRVFSATNAATFVVYGAIGGLAMWLVVTLQVVSGVEPVLAGLVLLPLTVCMLLLSPVAGAVYQRIGPTVPMTVGPLVAGAGVALLARIDSEINYVVDALLPTTMFGLGMAATVTPLTSTALASVPDRLAGVASGVNNAVARTAGLLTVALLPVVTGLGSDGFGDPHDLGPAFRTAMLVCAGLMVTGGLIAAAFVRRPADDGQEHHAECPDRHCDVCGPPVVATAETAATTA